MRVAHVVKDLVSALLLSLADALFELPLQLRVVAVKVFCAVDFIVHHSAL